MFVDMKLIFTNYCPKVFVYTFLTNAILFSTPTAHAGANKDPFPVENAHSLSQNAIIKTLNFASKEKEETKIARNSIPTVTSTHRVSTAQTVQEPPVTVEQPPSHHHPSITEIKDHKLASSLRLYMKEKGRNPELIDSIYEAAQKTGINFELIAIKAIIESNLGSHTIAPNSSTHGFFRFSENAWLSLIKHHGDDIGYFMHAKALKYNPSKKCYDVKEDSQITLSQVLDLRNNAKINSLIKAYQITDNQNILEKFKEGKKPNITDHYIIQTLGLPLAHTFYRLKNNNSPIIVAHLRNAPFNQVIKTNPSFFYDENNKALNAAQIYANFTRATSQKIEELRAIDKRFGNGKNVMAQSYTKTFLIPAQNRKNAQLNMVEPAASPKRDIRNAKKSRFSLW